CGLLFAKWTKRQQKLDETARQMKPDEVSEVPPLETVDAWTERGGRICAGMLLAGFFLPLLKYSMLYGKTKLVLPWHIMGVGMDAEKAAAMATLSGGGNMVVWTLLPLVAGVVGMVACTRLSFHWRVIALLAAGAALLVMLEAVFIREAEILGIMFIAPTVGGGVVSCAAICAGAAVAIANHLRKMFPEHLPARIMSGSGGLVIGALSCLALFAGEDAWKYWTVKIVCVSLMGYGALGVISAVQRDPAPTLLKTISYAARAILVWIPFACLFAQTYGAGAFVDYVISSGGGFVQNLLAMLKCFCLFYGSAFMMAFGGAGLLEEMLVKKGSKS
ncbi:MAG: hypothetical protein GY868_18675, partial [Deltaproteobacteria bacterium]|nr:hypothetical protein [Deltaproteobacteria bacterium]